MHEAHKTAAASIPSAAVWTLKPQVSKKWFLERTRDIHTHTDLGFARDLHWYQMWMNEPSLTLSIERHTGEGKWMIFWRPSVFLFFLKKIPKQKFILLLVTSVGAGISSFGWTSTHTGTLSLNNPKISSKLFLNVVNLFRIIFRSNLDENLGFFNL